jgi:hypothetical protein
VVWDSNGESPDDGVPVDVFNRREIQHGQLYRAEGHSSGEEGKHSAPRCLVSLSTRRIEQR